MGRIEVTTIGYERAVRYPDDTVLRVKRRKGGTQYKIVRKRAEWNNLDYLVADFIVMDSGERIDLLRRGQ